MTREDLKRIIEGISDEQLKAILDINSADIGKAKKGFLEQKTENDTLKSERKTLEEKISTLTDELRDGVDYKKRYEDLKKEMNEKEEEAMRQKEDEELTRKILMCFGDAVLDNPYIKNGLISDMKEQIKLPENEGKTYEEIFEAFTRDKEGIFKNPNSPLEIAGVGSKEIDVLTREEFESMGYKAKSELYKNNKDLYERLSKE